MAKFRSKTNYAQIYAGDKEGYNLGLDGSIYLRQETTPRTFNVPRVGTAGVSNGAVSASTDISASPTPATLKANVSVLGVASGALTASIAVAGLTTGVLIAAAVETAINAALAAAGLDSRVWVEFLSGGPDQYKVHNQHTGVGSTVVITAGVSNNIADDLKLGLANGGTETDGTNDQDALLYTTGDFTFSQPVESNQHRSGRYHSGIIRKKKVCEFDFDTYVNMSGTAGDSIDTAVSLLMEAMLGKKTTNAGSDITFEQDLPVIYMSAAKVSTIFGEYYNGAYVRQMNMSFPGDGPATVKYQGKAADAAIAGLAKLASGSVASPTVTLMTGESKRYTAGAYVMGVDTDGRTILYGHDGSVKVSSYDDSLDTVLLDTSVTHPSGGFLVPWDPGAIQKTVRDAIYTDLLGTMKLVATASPVDVTDIQLTMNNDHVDLDNRFGADANKGYVAGNRMTPELSVTFDLSNETMGSVIRTRLFTGLTPEIVLGSVSSGRYMKITAPKWIPAVPTLPVPENGTTPTTLVGNLFESNPGARDPIKIKLG